MRIVYIEPQAELVPGSLLKAKSLGLWPNHFGIFDDVGPDGVAMVLHSIEQGVVLTSLEEFARGRCVEIVIQPGTLDHQGAILSRAHSQVGHPYNLLFANCEHFATWAFYGDPQSRQVGQYVAGACAVGLGLWWLFGGGGETV